MWQAWNEYTWEEKGRSHVWKKCVGRNGVWGALEMGLGRWNGQRRLPSWQGRLREVFYRRAAQCQGESSRPYRKSIQISLRGFLCSVLHYVASHPAAYLCSCSAFPSLSIYLCLSQILRVLGRNVKLPTSPSSLFHLKFLLYFIFWALLLYSHFSSSRLDALENSSGFSLWFCKFMACHILTLIWKALGCRLHWFSLNVVDYF